MGVRASPLEPVVNQLEIDGVVDILDFESRFVGSIPTSPARNNDLGIWYNGITMALHVVDGSSILPISTKHLTHGGCYVTAKAERRAYLLARLCYEIRADRKAITKQFMHVLF